MNNKKIILIGFKHTGKTTIGKKLAKILGLNFVDLDEEIERNFLVKNGKRENFRDIFKKFGEKFFRELENESLGKLIKDEKVKIIALGGSAPLFKNNQELIKDNFIVNIIADKGVVFERIMVNGLPAFFSEDKDNYDNFLNFWEKREVVYKSLANHNLENDGRLEEELEKLKFVVA